MAAYVARRDTGLVVRKTAVRPMLIEGFLPRVEGWVDSSKGKVRADRVHDKLLALAFTGSERPTRLTGVTVHSAQHPELTPRESARPDVYRVPTGLSGQPVVPIHPDLYPVLGGRDMDRHPGLCRVGRGGSRSRRSDRRRRRRGDRPCAHRQRRCYWAAGFTAIGEFLASVDATCTPIGETSRVYCDGEASLVIDNLITCALIARRDGEGLTRWTRHS